MKKSVLLSLLIGVGCIVASSFTVVYHTGEPSHTGSPVDGGSTCASCHGGGVTPVGAITASPAFGGSGTSLTYTPGTTYTLTVTETANVDFGFDVEILNGNTSSATDAGTMTAISSNCFVNGTGPTNITHNSWISISSNAQFKWVAPASGTAYLYASILGVNGDRSTGGDKVMTIADVLTPAGFVCHKTYAPLPYSTSFENTWLTDSCNSGAQRIPDVYWKSNIGGTTPNGNDYWHRDDYTGSDWTLTTSGAYTPVSSNGSYSARFHNDPPPAGSTGALDLYINLSTSGTKNIKFDYIHNESSPSPFSFDVLLSTDGGSTFSNTLYSITTASYSTWTTQTFTTTATSSTAVLRFIVTDKGTHDVGIDNLSVSLSTSADIATWIDHADIEVFPNPTNEILYVKGLLLDENTRLQIIDMSGNMVKEISINSNQTSINVADLSEGMYTISINSNKGVVNKRVVIVR
ncbi:MAG: T9SS type A sorting domain-containing protein [Bacteroidia bacterium]